MKRIILLLLCCGMLVSMVGCSGNTAPPPTESPPTTVSETIITETPIKTAPPMTAVEPTEKEKEPIPTESRADCDRHRANRRNNGKRYKHRKRKSYPSD